MQSVLEAMENDEEYAPNFESIEDSAKDLINYSSFMISYMRHGIDGQSIDRDFLNRKITLDDTRKDIFHADLKKEHSDEKMA